MSAEESFRFSAVGKQSEHSVDLATFKRSNQSISIHMHETDSFEIININNQRSLAYLRFEQVLSQNLVKLTADLYRVVDSDSNERQGAQTTLVFLRFMKDNSILSRWFLLSLSNPDHKQYINNVVTMLAKPDALELGFYVNVPGHWVLENIELYHVELTKRYLLTRVILLVLWSGLSVYILSTVFSRATFFM